jgi:hypothetical protein
LKSLAKLGEGGISTYGGLQGRARHEEVEEEDSENSKSISACQG